MKVQRKHFPNKTYEVLEESPNYFIIKGTNTFVHVVPKADYEPVEEWVSIYTFEMCGMKGKEVRAVHSGNGFITIEVKR